jgi:hypothetical protein
MQLQEYLTRDDRVVLPVWRDALGDGSFGGLYQRPDAEVLRVWEAAVKQLRERLENGWSRPDPGRADP